jgi:flavodoxin
MKTLILFYSRTGLTKRVAEKIAEALGADIEEVIDTADRSGANGYLISGRDAALNRLAKIKDLNHNLSNYDLVVVGTPIWAWNMATPIRTVLSEQKDKIKQTAFFCTQGDSGAKQAFSKMARLIGRDPIDCLALKSKEVVNDKIQKSLEEFVVKLKNAVKI